jgi:CMP-N-acetylneuraminic acid synthetase
MKPKKRIVALLPLKANSERVKGKNFKLLAGKPLYQWILDALLSLDEIDLVVINTDARDILEQTGLLESDRVVIRDRAPALRGDLVSMNLILEDDIKHVPADIYLMTHTTNPLLGPSTIRDAMTQFVDSDSKDSLFSVNKIQTRFYREDLTAVNHDPAELVRTQDLEPWFEENSCLYIFSKESFFETNARIGKAPILFVTPALESIDIDEIDDWVVAEALALHQSRNLNPE